MNEEFLITFECKGCGATTVADSREAHPECETCCVHGFIPRVMSAVVEGETND